MAKADLMINLLTIQPQNFEGKYMLIFKKKITGMLMISC